MHDRDESIITADVPKQPRSRLRKAIYIAIGVIILIAATGAILLTFYPNTIIHYVVEPKLKQLVVERLGKRYALEMKTIALSPHKDSLILTGVRIIDNGKTLDGSTDTSSPDFGVATPLDRFSTDTVTIAGLDYWKLIFQKGLFADTINVYSPKIYLRPGSLPKFEANSNLLPSFLPAVSAKRIKIDNATIYFSEGKPTAQSTVYYDNQDALPPHVGGMLVKKASLEFRDFYLDEPTFQKATATFFCKGATFHAEDISHEDSLGVIDITVASVHGDLIDSSMSVYTLVAKRPIEEIRQVAVAEVMFSGLDWFRALAGQGLHAKDIAVNAPQIVLQDIADITSKNNTLQHTSASDLIPLPSLLPSIEVESVKVTNAEVYALLPQTKSVSVLRRITMSLAGLKIDSATPFENISSFFSKNAQYGIKGESTVQTSLGAVKFGQVDGTEKSVVVSNINMKPSFKGLKLVKLKSAEIVGIDIWKLLMRQGLITSSIVLHKPEVFLDESIAPPITSLNSLLEIDPLAAIRNFKQYPLPSLFPTASIGSITATDGLVYGIHSFDNSDNPRNQGDSISHLRLTLKNFKLNPTTWSSKRGMLFSDVATFEVGAIRQHTNGANYTYSIGGIKGDLRKRSVMITTASVKPLISEDSFGNAFKYRTERFDMFAPKISLVGIDFQRLLLGKGLYLDSILLSDWKMQIYGDRRKPEEARTVRDKFPHELFQQIKMPIGVQSVVAQNGEIAFRESWADANEPGEVLLSGINARIKNISNDNNASSQSKATLIEGDLKLMNAALVNFTIAYKMMNPQLSMDISAKAGGMDLSLLNKYLALTEPFIVKGVLRDADVSIDLNGNMMKGIITPRYDSLDVQFFRWDKFPPGIFSFIANTFFMRSHNTTERDIPIHSGEISTELDRSVSLFWALWHPIRAAISSVVRIPEWVW